MAILVNDKRDVSVSNDFETSGFKIQASAKAFEILSSNIYTNKVRAVIREYTCNAYDSQVEAGQDRPFDVHLPTTLEPHFSIRDYGTGLSDEQVREIFTTYFHSTKTHSNDFVGALGLGSKAGFSLVDSFTVTSYYNGTKTDYSCYKDECGEPQVALLCSVDTDEPNGLEVSMSVEGRQDDFEYEAVNVFKYFDKLPNINDQEVVKQIKEAKSDYKFVCDEGSFNTGYGNLYARMGNVAYKIPSEYNSDLSGFINFEIGDLSFNAGREELSMDDSTKRALTDRIQQVTDSLAQTVYDNLEAEQCTFTRAKKKAEVFSGSLRLVLRKSNLDFHKFDLPTIPDGDDRITTYQRGTWYRDSTDINSVSRLPIVNNNDYKIRYFLHQDRMKTRIMSRMKDVRGLICVVLTQEQIDFFGIPSDLIGDLGAFAPKLDRGHTGSSPSRSKVAKWNRTEPTWRVKANDCWSDTEVENDGAERVYVQIDRYNPTNCSWGISQFKNVLDSLDHLGIGIGNIYGLKTAFLKTKAFKSGNWISLDEYVKRESANLPEITLNKKHSDYQSYNSLFKKLGEKIDNELINDYNDTVESMKGEHSDRFAYETLHMADKIKYQDLLGDLSNKIVDEFPIIKLLSSNGSYACTEQVEILSKYIQGYK